MAEPLKNFFGLLDHPYLTNEGNSSSDSSMVASLTSVHPFIWRFQPSLPSSTLLPVQVNGSSGRVHMTHRIVSNFAGPASSFFGYNVEQLSYILIASGCLGALVFVVAFYTVMFCKKVIDRRRNARWLAMGFSPSNDSGLAFTRADCARSEVFLVHFPHMPRSTTDVFLGNIGFPPLVPPAYELSPTQLESDPFIRLAPDDITVRMGANTTLILPERLI